MSVRILVVLPGPAAASEAGSELLSVAAQVATRAGGAVTALLLGGADDVAAAAFAQGADEVLTVEAPWLAAAGEEGFVEAAAAAIAAVEPTVVLLAHDAAGRDAAPALAGRFGGALISDCVAIDFDRATGALTGTRPSFSGKALGEWAAEGSGVKFATIRPRAIAAPAPAARTGTPRTLALPSPALRTRVRERVAPPAGQARLEDAEVVVAVGRGVGSREAFERYFAEGLARALGAPCGGSRGAVDLGIVPREWQIGLTGRVVSPRLYIAVGLSGSPQHMAGCSGARTIVAVNTDPQAPIFGFAHYGVVGDYREVVPALTARLADLAAER